MIYLDHAATTPMSEKALEVYINVAKHYYGNASSLHDEGSSAQQILEASSKTLAATINARPQDVYFTSGASESNFLAIYSLLKGSASKGKHLITTPLEHSSVRNLFLRLKGEGYEISEIAVDEFGRVEMTDLERLVRDDTVLASIQHVNSELGIIQKISDIGHYLHSKGVLLHSDCVQSYGRLALDVTKMNVDAISISSHKIYGPKGVGAAWMNPQANWKPVFPDPDHPLSFKPGTDDVPSIAAFAISAKIVEAERVSEQQRIKKLREKLISGIKQLNHEVEIIEHLEETIPNIIGVRFAGMEGQFLMLECNQAGLAVSTGSACQVGSDKANRSLIAIGKSEQEAREFIRLSLGRSNKPEQISLIIEKMSGILDRHFQKIHHTRIKE